MAKICPLKVHAALWQLAYFWLNIGNFGHNLIPGFLQDQENQEISKMPKKPGEKPGKPGKMQGTRKKVNLPPGKLDFMELYY